VAGEDVDTVSVVPDPLGPLDEQAASRASAATTTVPVTMPVRARVPRRACGPGW